MWRRGDAGGERGHRLQVFDELRPRHTHSHRRVIITRYPLFGERLAQVKARIAQMEQEKAAAESQ